MFVSLMNNQSVIRINDSRGSDDSDTVTVVDGLYHCIRERLAKA